MGSLFIIVYNKDSKGLFSEPYKVEVIKQKYIQIQTIRKSVTSPLMAFINCQFLFKI